MLVFSSQFGHRSTQAIISDRQASSQAEFTRQVTPRVDRDVNTGRLKAAAARMVWHYNNALFTILLESAIMRQA
jgi:hypothetical protein